MKFVARVMTIGGSKVFYERLIFQMAIVKWTEGGDIW